MRGDHKQQPRGRVSNSTLHDKGDPFDRAYRAIFFDWDGTAVPSRSAPIDDVAPLMKELLEGNVVLVIISGTTYSNVASGTLHQHFSSRALRNLFMGLGRGAFDYGFRRGKPIVLHETLPDQETLLRLHSLVFELHIHLLREYGISTDVVFSRPNYCKVDLLVRHDRAHRKHLDHGEVAMVCDILHHHGYDRGLRGLLQEIEEMAKEEHMQLKATTDAKYLEIGLTTKSDNVDFLLQRLLSRRGIAAGECSFWGDEFGLLAEGVEGSDAHMITPLTRKATFFDVSGSPLELPPEVIPVGGGVASFLGFLEHQLELHAR